MTRLAAVVLAGGVVGWISARGVKGQTVRLLDVVAIGPFLIWLAATRSRGPFVPLALGALGAATIAYNGRNFLHASGPG